MLESNTTLLNLNINSLLYNFEYVPLLLQELQMLPLQDFALLGQPLRDARRLHCVGEVILFCADFLPD